MYHRFHAPHDCAVERVTYISGDNWNANPIAPKRVEKLFCKNERALLRTKLEATGHVVTLVPVVTVLVASIRLHFLDVLFHLKYRGPNVIACYAPFRKGEEMGWFQHGSTIIVFAPDAFAMRKRAGRKRHSHETAADAVAVKASGAHAGHGCVNAARRQE
jgi:phosphatidylserine decarboxylase